MKMRRFEVNTRKKNLAPFKFILKEIKMEVKR